MEKLNMNIFMEKEKEGEKNNISMKSQIIVTGRK